MHLLCATNLIHGTLNHWCLLKIKIISKICQIYLINKWGTRRDRDRDGDRLAKMGERSLRNFLISTAFDSTDLRQDFFSDAIYWQKCLTLNLRKMWQSRNLQAEKWRKAVAKPCFIWVKGNIARINRSYGSWIWWGLMTIYTTMQLNNQHYNLQKHYLSTV